MRKKFLKLLLFLLGIFLLFFIIFLLGPQKDFQRVDNEPLELELNTDNIESYVLEKESKFNIKEDNEARIVWADSAVHKKTKYALVYLHGFSASYQEGYPLNVKIGQKYGMNTYLARLDQHGIEGDVALKNMTPAGLINSAKEAIAIGKALGDSLIIMSCSTGSTLSAILAPKEPLIAGMIMYSPNIDIYDPLSDLVTLPWGAEIMNMVMGGELIKIDYTENQSKYWNKTYHNDAVIALKTILNEWMNENLFSQINCPLYMAYYYKNEDEQDKVVSVSRMLDFYDQVSTPEYKKRKETVPNAQKHVISSPIFSQDVKTVENGTKRFLEEVINIRIRERSEDLQLVDR